MTAFASAFLARGQRYWRRDGVTERSTHRIELLDVAERVVKRQAVNVLGDPSFCTASSTERDILVCA